jgi:hypothetical protein
MRLPILAIILLLVTAALFGGSLATSAQSANSYPWCARYYKDGGGTPRCNFANHEQCTASISGIGGLCVRNLQYGPRAQPSTRRPRS